MGELPLPGHLELWIPAGCRYPLAAGARPSFCAAVAAPPPRAAAALRALAVRLCAAAARLAAEGVPAVHELACEVEAAVTGADGGPTLLAEAAAAGLANGAGEAGDGGASREGSGEVEDDEAEALEAGEEAAAEEGAGGPHAARSRSSGGRSSGSRGARAGRGGERAGGVSAREAARQSEALAAEQWRLDSDERHTEVRAARAALPAHGVREELCAMLRAHRAVLVCGETGCGKSTQIPHFLLEARPLPSRAAPSACRAARAPAWALGWPAALSPRAPQRPAAAQPIDPRPSSAAAGG